MSRAITLLRHILVALFVPAARPVDPDSMSLREWADLPVHHPLCERTPC